MNILDFFRQRQQPREAKIPSSKNQHIELGATQEHQTDVSSFIRESQIIRMEPAAPQYKPLDGRVEDIQQQKVRSARKESPDSSQKIKGIPTRISSSNDGDPMMNAAIDIVVETGMASVSSLQRKLKLGYSHAARLVDMMEEIGVVGPFEGSKPRKVLITKEQWAEMKVRGGIDHPFPPTLETTHPLPNDRLNETVEIQFELDNPHTYQKPSIDALAPVPPVPQENTDFAADMLRKLNDTLNAFRLKAEVSDYRQGALYTRFDATVPLNSRISQFRRSANDIAFAIGQTELSINPVPDAPSTIGFTMRNPVPMPLLLRSGVQSDPFQSALASALPFVVGQKYDGETFVGQVTSGHILILGRTGAGKSTLVDSMVTSMLYKVSPHDMRLLWIDPILVEAQAYWGIPHLLAPPITIPQRTVEALAWLGREIDRRHLLFYQQHRRQISAYNEFQWENFEDELPYIVVVLDGYAKLLESGDLDAVETALLKVLRTGPQVGVYVILSTQNASTKVMSTAVKSCFSTKILLPAGTAEARALIGDTEVPLPASTGEILFTQMGQLRPVQLNGYCVSDDEIRKVVTSINREPETEQ